MTNRKLDEPFLVLATRTIEQGVLYAKRRLIASCKLKIGYPSREEKQQILDLMARTSSLPKPSPWWIKDILKRPSHQRYLHGRQSEGLHVDLVCATRDQELQDQLGASFN